MRCPITHAIDDSREPDSIDIELKLSIIEPLYARWMMEVYNEMTLAEGKGGMLKKMGVIWYKRSS